MPRRNIILEGHVASVSILILFVSYDRFHATEGSINFIAMRYAVKCISAEHADKERCGYAESYYDAACNDGHCILSMGVRFYGLRVGCRLPFRCYQSALRHRLHDAWRACL